MYNDGIFQEYTSYHTYHNLDTHTVLEEDGEVSQEGLT